MTSIHKITMYNEFNYTITYKDLLQLKGRFCVEMQGQQGSGIKKKLFFFLSCFF